MAGGTTVNLLDMNTTDEVLVAVNANEAVALTNMRRQPMQQAVDIVVCIDGLVSNTAVTRGSASCFMAIILSP